MARSSVRGDYDTSARAKRIVIVAAIALFVAAWIGLVLWLGRMGSAESSRQASSEIPRAATAQEATTEERSTQGTDTAEPEPKARQPADSGVSPAQQEGSVPQGTFDPLEEGATEPADGSGASEQSVARPS